MARDRLTELREALTERQARWAEHFVASGNGTESARVAGYKGDASAWKAGHKNSKDPKVRAYVDALREHVQGGTTSTLLERVRDRLWLIGSGTPLPQFIRGKVVVAPPKLADQRGALRTLAQMLGGLDPRARVVLAPSVRAELEALRAHMPEDAYLVMLQAMANVARDRGEDVVDVEPEPEGSPRKLTA